MFRFHQYKKPSALAFQNEMKKLWEENSEHVVQLINHAVVQTDTAHEWGATLANNQQRIANGIIHFYGDREKLSDLFNQFIQHIGEAIDVFQWRKDASRFRERWCRKADELSDALQKLSTWTIRGYFYKQMVLIESLIKSFMTRDVEAIKYFRQELTTNNINLSTTFSNAIISENRKSFI